MSDVSATTFRRLLPPEVLAIMMKDFKQIRRDLSNMSQVIGPLIMGIVLTVMLLRSGGEPPAGRGEAPTLFMSLFRSAMSYGSMVISLFVGWGLLARLALIAFSMEGRSYWILKTAPVSAGKQLAAKFLMAYLPPLILGWIYLLGVALLQNAPSTTILYGLPSIALILAGLGGINLAFGVRGVNLTWTDPRHMENGVAGFLGIITSVVYQLTTLLLFFVPPLGLPLLGISEGTGMMVGLLAGGTVALLCTILPLALVKERVCRIGEE
jgi:ABC-2 type transport system permease protein